MAREQVQPLRGAAPNPLRAALALSWREVIRFLRQKNRVVGAIGQPLVFWLLFGAGLNRTFQLPGQSFSHYFVPGTLVLILLFTAIFSTISLIEDRQEGFLQSVLVAPLPRWCLVAGKVVGGSSLAIGQGLIFLGFVSLGGVRPVAAAGVGLLLMMTLTAVSLTCVGFVIAWRLDSTQGFHAIMNLLLMPMWLLSGAFFPVPPVGSEATWGELALHGMMRANPLTYAVAGVRHLLFAGWHSSAAIRTESFWLPRLSTCWCVTFGFAVFMFLVASRRAATYDGRSVMSRAVGFWIAVLLIFAGGMLAWFAKNYLRQEPVGVLRVPESSRPDLSLPPLTEFELVDQNGARMNSKALAGEVWAGSFFFAKCPSTCYSQNMKLQQLQAQFGPHGLKLVSITCDPANDSPVALAEYASRFHADAKNWHFLTTSDADIAYLQRIGNDFFQVMVGPETHSDRVVLFDRSGRQRGAFSVLRPDQFLQCQKLLDELLSEPADGGSPSTETPVSEQASAADDSAA